MNGRKRILFKQNITFLIYQKLTGFCLYLIDLVSLVTVFDAILTSVGKSVRNYGVCMRI